MLVAGGVLLPLPVRSQGTSSSDGLTLEGAIAFAVQNNPEYGVQASSLETLRWKRREAWGSFVPSATISNYFGYTAGGERQFGDFTLGTRPAQLASGYSLGLSLSLDGESFLRPGLVGAQEEATRARVSGAYVGLVNEVTRRYLVALQADEELEQALAEMARAITYVVQAEAQVAVGSATPLDARRADIQLGQAEVQVLQTQNAAVTTRLALIQTMGAEILSDQTLATRFELFEPQLDAEDLLEVALAQNPTLRASQREATAAQRQTRIVQSRYLPTVSLSAAWSGTVFEAERIDPLVSGALSQLSGQFDGCVQHNRVLHLLGDPLADCGGLNPSDPTVAASVWADLRQQNQGFPFGYESQPLSLSANVSVPLFTGFSRQLQVEEARVAAANAERFFRTEELRLQAEVEAAVRTVQTAQRTAELQASIRAMAGDELTLAEERFRLGLASSLEVVDAQANLSQAERDEISAVYDFHISFAALEAMVGVPLRE
jgi:outer membrane protein